MVQTGGDQSPVRVLQSFGVPRATTNPYLVQLVGSLPSDVAFVPFSWRTAFFGAYDVVHLHWPELLARGRTRPRALARGALTALLLVRWRATRTPVVRTLHNASPHESGPLPERLLLRAIDRLTTERVALNPDDAEGPATTLVLHGHYRDWYAAHPRSPSTPGRLAFVGLVRPYKNVPHLLASFSDLDDPAARLVVAGAVRDDDLRREIVSQAAQDDRVDIRLEHLDDADLARVVTESSLVVLPYAEMGNSGVALLALSLGRPVLVPRSHAMVALEPEVGPGWVRFFDAPLDAADLRRALDAGPPDTPSPDLGAREWDDAGHAHAAVYRRAIARRARTSGGV